MKNLTVSLASKDFGRLLMCKLRGKPFKAMNIRNLKRVLKSIDLLTSINFCDVIYFES